MSVDVMSAVWKQSKATGTALLLLLAIADNANSEGKAYPSVKRLAQKIRTSERNVQLLLRKLEELGELTIELQTERRGCNAYYVLLGANGGEEDFTPPPKQPAPRGEGGFTPPGEEGFTGGEEDFTPPGEEGFTGGEEDFTGGVKVASPEPSREQPLSLLSSSSGASAGEESGGGGATVAPPADLDAAYQEVRAVYENNFGLLTSVLSKRIKEALGAYPPQWIPMAMERAVTAEKRRWDYVEGILRNWKAEGLNGQPPGPKRTGKSGASNGSAKPIPEPGNSQADYIASLPAEWRS
jgi:DnaD/phage-associated family protein